MEPLRLSRIPVSNPHEQIKTTLRLIGQAIKEGSEYLPIRNYAASLATKAPPKDYLGQLNAVYDNFVKSWRYVRDPVHKELVAISPKAIYSLILGKNAGTPGNPNSKGYGDCDDCAAALGSALRSIGFPVRIAVTAPPGAMAGPTFSHVFVQASVPGIGWLTVDPVPYPRRGLGYTPEHSRIAYYDLDGRLIGYQGNVQGLAGDNENKKEVIDMHTNQNMIPDLTQWQDIGLSGTTDNADPLDWRKHVLKDFGIYSHALGIMSGEGMNLAAEVEFWHGDNGTIIARTPMLEVSPNDYAYLRTNRKPYHGMLALGDEGQAYEYDGFSGFFKKLFKKAKGLVQKIGKGAKRVLKKIPGGKYLVKIGEKIHKVAAKFVRPLVKYVGKYAAKLAPVAAIIPGYGPAIAAGLATAGKIAKLMQKHGVELIGKAGQARNLKFKSDSHAKAFQADLQKEAERAARKVQISRSQRKQARRSAVQARRAPFRAAGQRAIAAVRAGR